MTSLEILQILTYRPEIVKFLDVGGGGAYDNGEMVRNIQQGGD